MKLNIPTRGIVQWITIMIARHKWNYETKIPTMRTVQRTTILIAKDTSETMKLNIPTMRTVKWITILIAEHQWNNVTKHTYYENCTMNYNPDSKTLVKLRN